MKLDKNQITFIIPLDFSRRAHEIYHRALSLSLFLERKNIYVKFGVSNSNKLFLKKFKKEIDKLEFSSIIETTESNNINLSLLRNIALKATLTDFVIFLDVDIYINEQILDILLNNNQYNLNIYPCFYLTSKGNKFIKKYNYHEMIDFYFCFRRDLFKHLAFPSSVIICDLKSVKEIDYFDENFINHGYEDLDFILRIMDYKGMLNKLAYYGDNKYRSIASMNGLRLQLCIPFFDNIKNNYFTFHLHHTKNIHDNYHKNDNYIYFHRKHEKKLKNQNDRNNFYIEFHDFCIKNHLDFNQYLVFFDAMPGHMWRSYSLFDFYLNFFKRLRRVFNRKKVKEIK